MSGTPTAEVEIQVIKIFLWHLCKALLWIFGTLAVLVGLVMLHAFIVTLPAIVISCLGIALLAIIWAAGETALSMEKKSTPKRIPEKW